MLDPLHTFATFRKYRVTCQNLGATQCLHNAPLVIVALVGGRVRVASLTSLGMKIPAIMAGLKINKHLILNHPGRGEREQPASELLATGHRNENLFEQKTN